MIAQIGVFIQYWGFKAVHGRIWCALCLSVEPLDAKALMDQLKISKALVSLTLKDLLHYNVVRISGKTAQGTQTYDINPNVRDVIFNVLKMRELSMLQEISNAHSQVSGLGQKKLQDCGVNLQRLKDLEAMIHTGQDLLNAMFELRNFDLGALSILNVKDS